MRLFRLHRFLWLGLLSLLPSHPVLAQNGSPNGSNLIAQGNQVVLNGKSQAIAWGQWRSRDGRTVIGISDVGLMRRFGLDLADSEDARLQPVFWFSDRELPLVTQFSSSGEYRYLDITSLEQRGGWRTQVQGNSLQIATPTSQITNLRLGQQAWGSRLVIELDRPTPWMISRLTNSRNGITPRELSISLDAQIDASLANRLTTPTGSGMSGVTVASENGRTVIKATLSGSLRPQVLMLDSPNRLIVDLRGDAPPSRNIVWYPGMRWREQTLTLGGRQFPITWLAITPRQVKLRLQPIWGNGNNSLVGIQPLAQLGQAWQAAAVINAGFFNRDRQLPLGAIRRNGQWISGPILNRGVMAWNDSGEFRVGRLSLQQTLSSANGQRFNLTDLNSGYVQSGLARYTRAWGAAYTPLSGQETIATVVNNQITDQQPSRPTAIPENGFVLVGRRVDLTSALPVGTTVQLQTQATPAGLDDLPNMIGAGPLLVESGRVVLNATAEQFGKGLDAQLAPRSGIAQTADGTVILATTHNRIGGAGPSLLEWAQLLRGMGAVSALNLDGGSSSSLYLGGQLIDRHPVTATRIHNGIGVFIQPLP